MYRDHRERFLEKLAESGCAAVIPTARHKVRNHDCEYRFRPTSDFWYLTGFEEPESVLVLLPEGIRKQDSDEEREGEPSGPVRSVLFLRDRDAKLETWTGRRLGVERAPAALGVDEARPISKLWDDLPGLLADYQRIVYRLGADEVDDRGMIETLGRLRAKARNGIEPPNEVVDPAPLLHEQRLFKSEAELALMRQAAQVTCAGHVAAMSVAEPGMREYELEAIISHEFRRHGASGVAYETIVAGGENGCILHYTENDAVMNDGDLVLIDAGSEHDYYACDVTRTFPVNGTFSLEQRAIYDLVLEAEMSAIEAVGPGVAFKTIHETALGVLVRGLIRLGLVEGTEEEVIEKELYKPVFMHKTSHWMGLDVHDCGAYTTDGESRVLEPGMVFTVEPGLYISEENEDVDPRWRGIAVRIEDDILVTANGYQVLTAAIPKTVEEVEAACGGRDLEPAI